MKRLKLEQNTPEWLEWRKGKITGSRLGDIVVRRGNNRKLGFYEVLAERLSKETGVEHDNPMDRGHDLEGEALDLFTEITGMEVKRNCGVWVSDISEHIALSPDGEINAKEAVEVKCLGSAKHLQAFFEKKIPDEYWEQAMQYFIVNEKLKALYFVFYDPRIVCKPLHYILLSRADLKDEIDLCREYEEEALQDIEDKVNQLTF